MKFAVSTSRITRDLMNTGYSPVDEQTCDIIKGFIPAYIKYLKYKRSGKYNIVSISRR